MRENLIGLPLQHLSPTRRLCCIRLACNKEIWCKLTGHDSVKTAGNLQMCCSLYDYFSYPHPFCGTENCVAALILLSQCNLYYYEASPIITTRDIINCLTWIRKRSPNRTISVPHPSTEKFGSAVKNLTRIPKFPTSDLRHELSYIAETGLLHYYVQIMTVYV